MTRGILIALFLLAPLKSSAEETAAFLKIGVGARALGMGEAYTAIANDINAIAWNPAGLGTMANGEAGAVHTQLAAGASFDFLGYAQPTRYGVFGAGFMRLGQGSVDGRDALGHPSDGFSASDEAVNMSYAVRLAPRFHLGGNAKYIQSSIADVSARTFALDLGGMYQLSRLGPGVPEIGFAIQNMGPGMRFLDNRSNLPLTAAVGFGYVLPAGLTLAMDVRSRPRSNTNEIAVGTEYAIVPMVALRMGYASAVVSPGGSNSVLQRVGGLSGLGAGLGLRFSRYMVDYAIRPMSELGNAQQVSLGARF